MGFIITPGRCSLHLTLLCFSLLLFFIRFIKQDTLFAFTHLDKRSMVYKHNNSSDNDNDTSLQAKPNDITGANKSAKHEDGRPLRPMMAYDIFFQMERNRIMKEQANPDAKRTSIESDISDRWKKVDGTLKIELDAMAKLDKERFDRENEEWKAHIMLKKVEDHEAAVRAKSFADTLEKTPAREPSLNELILTTMATPQGGSRQSLSARFAGTVVPPLLFKAKARPQGIVRLNANNKTGGPHIIP
jgi:hypothetical protein